MSEADENEDTSRWIGRVIAGRYRLVRLVGKGGMGAVFEARHIQTEKQLAVKLLADRLSRDLKLVARFRREALAASRLDHENCVRVYDYGQDDDGTFYIVMELIDGIGLNREVRRAGPMGQARVARIAVQLLGALDAAHAEGVLHRDLKPPNVMLTRLGGHDDVVKVVDFGIAKLVENSVEDRAALTIPGTIFGTPEYMSPEQARGDPLDGRSDQFSAGAVLLHLMLGRSPFRGQTVRETLANVFTLDPPSPRDENPACDITPEFEAVVRRALNKSANARYRDTAAFLAALQPFAEKTSLLPSFTQRPLVPGVRDDGVVPETLPGSGPVPAGFLSANGPADDATVVDPEASTAVIPPAAASQAETIADQNESIASKTALEEIAVEAPPQTGTRTAVLSPRGANTLTVVGISVGAGLFGAGLAYFVSTSDLLRPRPSLPPTTDVQPRDPTPPGPDSPNSPTPPPVAVAPPVDDPSTTPEKRPEATPPIDPPPMGVDTPTSIGPTGIDEVGALRAALDAPDLSPAERRARADALLAKVPDDGNALFKAATGALGSGDKAAALEYVKRLEALGEPWSSQVALMRRMLEAAGVH